MDFGLHMEGAKKLVAGDFIRTVGNRRKVPERLDGLFGLRVLCIEYTPRNVE